MATTSVVEVVMPQMGVSVSEGTITKWLKQVGDQVAVDEPLFEVSTDKVDSEVPSPVAGVLTEIVVPEGDTVDVGARLAVVGDGAAGGCGHLGVDLVGRDLEQRLVGVDVVADLLQPAGDRAFRDRLPQLGHRHVHCALLGGSGTSD